MKGKKPAKKAIAKPSQAGTAKFRSLEHLVLSEWIYALNMLSRMYKPGLFREAALIATRHWAKKTLGVKLAQKSDFETAKAYIHLLAKNGVEDEKRIKLKKAGKNIRLEVTQPCLFRHACIWTSKQKIEPQCARGLAIATGLGGLPAHKYALKLKKFDPEKKCLIEFVRLK